VVAEVGKSWGVLVNSPLSKMACCIDSHEANVVINREVIISFDLSYLYTQTTPSHRQTFTIFDPRPCLVALADIDNSGQR